MFGRATIRLGIGPHSSFIIVSITSFNTFVDCDMEHRRLHLHTYTTLQAAKLHTNVGESTVIADMQYVSFKQRPH